MRILYVEDNPANLYLVKRVAMGHEVINYIDAEEAMRNFDQDSPDLVLMDIQLAGPMTGLDMVAKLRSDGHTIPIIAVTAYAMVGDREKCLAAGCDDYLAKPLPIPKLVSMFKEYNEQAKKRRAASAEAAPPAANALSPAPAVTAITSPPASAITASESAPTGADKPETPPVAAAESSDKQEEPAPVEKPAAETPAPEKPAVVAAVSKLNQVDEESKSAAAPVNAESEPEKEGQDSQRPAEEVSS